MIPPIAIRYLPHAMAVLAALGAAAWVYSGIWDRGYDSCKAQWDRANAEAMLARDAELDVARLRGEALSAGLAQKERELSTLNREYLTYASAITGHCPESLGVLVAAASTATSVPQTPSAPASPPPATSSAVVAANVAENYTRAWVCIAQLNALIDWHSAAEAAVSSTP